MFTEIKLEKNLVLNQFIQDLLGFSKTEEILGLLKKVKEGYDEEGKSFFYSFLKSQKNIKISLNKLELYDYNIKNHLKLINKKRHFPIQLKYYQYIALLYAEIYLDNIFTNLKDFNERLNEFVLYKYPNNYDFLYTPDSLNKLAYWMATGSGKTIILHLNYLQFLHYNKGPNMLEYENIILVTPNENLSKQHFDELLKSNISCEIFSQTNQGYFSNLLDHNVIKIIDIHKLTEEKKGQGVTIDIEFFSSKNVIFVDEGHKGSGGEKWKNCRDFISREGFAFEYSATFGQAINRPSKHQKELLFEYAKAIIFDYSYHYFHNDGFGKEYRIMNLKKNVYSDSKNQLMLANLLAFYEQKIIFKNYEKEIRDYNIEEPLWIFIGSRVSGKDQQSDIFEIIQFLDNFIKNNDNWVPKSIDNILKGKSGIIDKKNHDIFSPIYPEKKLAFLRDYHSDPKIIYTNILKDIFHITSPSQLYLVDLKKAEGEIALKLANSDYFGLITIGDKSAFLKLVENRGKGIFIIQEDIFSKSIFDEINKKSSKIQILIGAKKFIEGWDSWRVSNMGLLNIGKREGTQIIQLFGRGVRLKGKNMSLKRSNKLIDNPPKYLTILETLNIFGIKANYMEEFKELLESEGIKTDNVIEFPIPIKINQDYLTKDLQIPVLEESKFQEEYLFELAYDPKVNVSLDLIPRAEIIDSQKDLGIQATTSKAPHHISNEYLDLFDWDDIFFDLYNYRSDKDWWNIIFTKKTLQRIIGMRQYTLYCIPKMLEIEKFEQKYQLEEIVKNILRKYLTSYYNKIRNNWMRDNMSLEALKSTHKNFQDYLITIDESQPLIISELENLLRNNIDDFRKGKNQGNYLKNAYFENHLYQPLLIDSDYFTISPKGLIEKGEYDFIDNLNKFISKKPDLLKDKQIFLLRNLPKIGVGFFEEYYFYPDFILWIIEKTKQHIVFIDPKGLVFMQKGLQEPKIKLNKDIKDIQDILIKKTNKQITLDSFIISVSEYNTIKHKFTINKETFEREKVLFQEDKDHIMKLFEASILA